MLMRERGKIHHFKVNFYFVPLHFYANKRNIISILSGAFISSSQHLLHKLFFFIFRFHIGLWFVRMFTAIWIMCIFAVASAGSFHKQKTTATAVIQNTTLVRDIYLKQQHILQHTRYFLFLTTLLCSSNPINALWVKKLITFFTKSFFFCRHHNVVANKSKIMKHNDQMPTTPPFIDESNRQENINVPSPIKRFPLRNIPLYHAYYHQHTYNSSDLSHELPRNRSSIQKRASSGEKKISTNITMVLEGLLQ